MYNEELEKLIDYALTDGVLTEKEKQVLFKKAETIGVDLDEFEMVLEARLFEKQKKAQLNETNTGVAPQSNKFGDVKKCPVCGGIVQSFQTQCADLKCSKRLRRVAKNKRWGNPSRVYFYKHTVWVEIKRITEKKKSLKIFRYRRPKRIYWSFWHLLFRMHVNWEIFLRAKTPRT